MPMSVDYINMFKRQVEQYKKKFDLFDEAEGSGHGIDEEETLSVKLAIFYTYTYRTLLFTLYSQNLLVSLWNFPTNNFYKSSIYIYESRCGKCPEEMVNKPWASDGWKKFCTTFHGWNPINSGMFTTPNRLIHIIADNFGDTQLRLQGITMRQLSFLANRWWAPNLSSFRWFCWLPSVSGQHGCYNQKTAPKKNTQLDPVGGFKHFNRQAPKGLGFVWLVQFWGVGPSVDIFGFIRIHKRMSFGNQDHSGMIEYGEFQKLLSVLIKADRADRGASGRWNGVSPSRVSFPYRFFTSVIKEQHR